MKKSFRKLIPAILMVLLSASLLGTSTFAWFSMNKKATTTGMMVRTKVSESLLIAGDELDSDEILGDNLFFNSLVQLQDGLIEPVSTVDGVHFFYTAGTNVQGNGAVLNQKWTAYDPSSRSAFNNEYGLTGTEAYGYVDYVFQIKAMNGGTASEIRLTKLDLTYGGDEDNDQLATRIAVFAENLGYKTGADDSELVDPAGTEGVLKAIYTPSGAANFSVAEGTSSTTPDAVSDVDERADVTYNEKFALSVGTNVTQYYKIVVRLWIEGEDTTCNNDTFMDLTDKWSLDLQWDLVATGTADSGDTAKVQYITLGTTAAKTALVTSDTVDTTAANTKTISGTAYYPITGKTLGSAQLYTTDTTLTTSSKVYTISADGLYPTNVTNQVTIKVAITSTDTVAASPTEIAGTDYYKLSDKKFDGKNLYIDSATLSNTSKFYIGNDETTPTAVTEVTSSIKYTVAP